MATKERTTKPSVTLDPEIDKALREKSESIGVPVSKLVNDAVRDMLDEDEADLAIIAERMEEPDIPYEEFRAGLKRRGKL